MMKNISKKKISSQKWKFQEAGLNLWCGLAEIARNKLKFKEFSIFIRKAIEINPIECLYWDYLAAAEGCLGDITAEFNALEHIRDIDPTYTGGRDKNIIERIALAYLARKSNQAFININFNLENYFNGKKPVTFLIGAGISVNSLSNLGSSKDMIDGILSFFVDEKELPKLKKIPSLLYETIIGLYQQIFDLKLKLMDYFSSCTIPNTIHLYLAEMVKKGHFLLTTNFDYLLEYAIKCGPRTRVVITQADFEQYNNPYTNCKKGLNVIYKIHGSKINVCTGQSTEESIITTLESLGKMKGGEMYSLDPFKRKLFDIICTDRTLIVMGYSGGDEFDIMPTLLELTNLTRLIWIVHSNMEMTKPLVYKLDRKVVLTEKELSSLPNDSILLYKLGKKRKIEIIKIIANTKSFISSYLPSSLKNHESSANNIPRSTLSWIKENLEKPSDFDKELFLGRLFDFYGNASEALLHFRRASDLSKNILNEERKIQILIDFGDSLIKNNALTEAKDVYLQILKKTKSFRAEIGLATIFQVEGMMEEALNICNECLKKYHLNSKDTALIYHHLGEIHLSLEEFEKAIHFYEQTLKINQELGNIPEIGSLFEDMATVFIYKQDKKKSKELLLKANEIFNKMEDSKHIEYCQLIIAMMELDLTQSDLINALNGKLTNDRVLQLIGKK